MKAKTIFFLLTLLIASGGSAHADRWIIKNPKSTAVAMNAIKSIDLGGDTYVVVEMPQFSTLAADVKNLGEEAIPDARIELPETRRSAVANRSAWHVKDMRYSDLPGTAKGDNVVVAVLDTGVDYNHKALKDRMWKNEKEIPNNQVDDDGNGYVDDYHGFDFEADDPDPMDGDIHGTHCAGVIVANADESSSAQGVAPGAKVMPVRIIGYERMGFISDAVAGIKYAADNGAKVISASWRVYKSWSSFDPSDSNIDLLKKAIEYAFEKGVVFVAAAGNESVNLDSSFERDPMYPGGYTGMSSLIVVAASDQRGMPAFYTNYGEKYVTVAAPGSDIISTVPGDRWESLSGTSMATPLVAGAIARGISASHASNVLVDKLISTCKVSDSWTTKVRAKGVVQLVEYLTP